MSDGCLGGRARNTSATLGWVCSSAGLLPLLSALENVWLAAQFDGETGKSVLEVMRDATRSAPPLYWPTHDQAVIEVADRVLSRQDGQLADRAPARP
jgi:ABC-type lipoprotein export system ATPase subunit